MAAADGYPLGSPAPAGRSMGLTDFVPVTPREGLAVGVAYLLGSLPFGLILGLLKGVDIRKAGSGNIGATNAGRVLGRPYGYAAFLGDFAKGWFPSALLGPWLAATPGREPLLAVLCGAAAVAGHVWPIYLRFHGGKAVSTGCGAVVGIDPIVFLGGGAAWLVCLALFRFVSLASIAMVLSFPLLFWLRQGVRPYGPETVAGAMLLALLVLLRHRPNLQRLLTGTEPRIGRRRDPA